MRCGTVHCFASLRFLFLYFWCHRQLRSAQLSTHLTFVRPVATTTISTRLRACCGSSGAGLHAAVPLRPRARHAAHRKCRVTSPRPPRHYSIPLDAACRNCTVHSFTLPTLAAESSAVSPAPRTEAPAAAASDQPACPFCVCI